MNLSRLTLLSLCCMLGASVVSHAAVPIERRALSNSSANSTSANNPAVAPTASLPIAPLLEPSQPSMLWQLTEQVQQLQEEVRRLRGNNESQEQKIETLEKELQSRFIDFDQRLEQLQEQLRSTQAETAPDSATTDTATDSSSTAAENSSSSITAPPPLKPAQPNNTAASRQPASTSAAEQKAYIGAYDAYKAGGTQKAIIAMQQFMRDYPNSVYIPNAHYWLGEFYLALTPPNFAEAQKTFNVVLSAYPKSARAAAAIYRLASIAELEQRPNEATRLMNILRNDYPDSAESGYAQEFLRKRSN
ncbi:MAG: tetratricopeptide repeat protein [Moraxellaceae bacterium]